MTLLPFLCMVASPVLAVAQLEWVQDGAVQETFAGEPCSIRVMFRNPTDQTVSADLRVRVFQTSSATAMPLSEPRLWKTIQVLGGQTVVEFFSVTLPNVRTRTRFLVQWIVEQNHVLGSSEVIVHPPDLLKTLNVLAGRTGLGVFDPQNALKPALTKAGVEFEDLDDVNQFEGRLAIIWEALSCESSSVDSLKLNPAVAAPKTAVIWIRNHCENPEHADSTIRLVCGRSQRIALAHASQFAQLSTDARSQYRLVRLAETVLKPETWDLSLLKP